jgi:predicted phosphoribosyltransferase
MTPVVRFVDRREAGRVLATRLLAYAGQPDVVVLGLPRGGIPVAYEVARALAAPLDVFVVRKLGAPLQPELALGAIASGGVRVLNADIIKVFGIPDEVLEQITYRERQELERRERAYRAGRPQVALASQQVILVDDGLATGSTMRAAVTAIRDLRPSKVIVAVPVGAPETCRELATIADEVVCVETPEPLESVGRWYRDFSQTTDDEVRDALRPTEAPGGDG